MRKFVQAFEEIARKFDQPKRMGLFSVLGQQEFVFVLEGAGEVVLDGVAHPIGPGDFVGFPIDGVVHSVVSKGPGDLVYLTAGTSGPVDGEYVRDVVRSVAQSGSFVVLQPLTAFKVLVNERPR